MAQSAQPWVTDVRPVTFSDVEFAGYDGRMVPSKFWHPSCDGKFPGIVFITEAFGLTSEMQRLGKTFASWGYAVLAPNLFTSGWIGCIRALMKDLRGGGGDSAKTLLLGRAFLGEQPFVDPSSVGVLGFCMGGGFALLLAQNELFRVAATFYGETPKTMARSCPVVASYGARDKIMTPAAEPLRRELERLGVEHDIKIYPDAGHSFMNDAPNALLGVLGRIAPMHSGYNEAAADDASQRAYRFFERHLGKASA